MPKMYLVTVTSINIEDERIIYANTQLFATKEAAEVAFDVEVETFYGDNADSDAGWEFDYNTVEGKRKWEDAYEDIKERYPVEETDHGKFLWIRGSLSGTVVMQEMNWELKTN